MYYLANSLEENIKTEAMENPSMFEKLIATFDWESISVDIIVTSIRIIFALIFFYIFSKVAKWGINLFFKNYFKNHIQKTNRYKTVYRVTFNVFNTIFYFFLIYTILEILSFPVGTLLASAGVVGLAISLGAQGFVSDLVNGFTMLMEKQLEIGDEVQINDVSGTVLNVNLRTTQIKSFDGTIHFVPNREITIISNRSKGDMRALILVRLFPDSDIERIREIIEKTNEDYVPSFDSITVPPGEVQFVSNEKNQLALRVTMYTKPGSQYGVMNKFYEIYVRELTEAGIELPFSDINIA